MTVLFKAEPPALSPPATESELSWWKAKRTATVSRAAMNAVGMMLVFIAGVAIAPTGQGVLWYATVKWVLALLLVGQFTVIALLAGNRDKDILLKRSTDELDARKKEFLAAMDEPHVAAIRPSPEADDGSY